MMAISDLLAVVPPPEKPVETIDEGAWVRAQVAIDTSLPDDYLGFGRHYGSGAFCGYLGVINPLSEGFERAVTYLLETIRDVSSFRQYAYKVFPEQPGLLPWGGDDNGNLFHWLTKGDPNSWPVVIESHAGDLERFELSMTSFLAKALTNKIRPAHIWGQPFTDDELFFSTH